MCFTTVSQLNSGQNFLTWRDSQFPVSHSPYL